MSELLVELRWDVLPPRGLDERAGRLQRMLAVELERRDLRPRQAAASFTGRRLMVLFRGLPERGETADGESRMTEALAAAVAGYLAAGDPGAPGPLRGVAAVWSGAAVRFEVDGVESGRSTIGHPLLSPRPFDFRDARNYASELVARGIEIRERQRRQRLEVAIRSRAGEVEGAEPVSDPALIELLVAGCEIPGTVLVPLDGRMTELPAEIVVHALATHLQGVALVDGGSGALRRHFVAVIDRADDPEGRVRAGYERAAGRLLDELSFYWQQDRATPLAERARALAAGDGEDPDRGRSRRIVELCGALVGQVGRRDAAVLEEAAELFDADRLTLMVDRFPGLRGIYGGLLAQREGYPERVWTAIYDQLEPVAASGPLPRGGIGKLLAIALRVDRLVSWYDTAAAGAPVTPVAETARGLLDILVRGEVPVDLDLLVAAALRQRRALLRHSVDELLDLLRGELWKRVRESWIDEGHAAEEVDAVLEASGGPHLLWEQHARLRAVHRLRHDPAFPALVRTACRVGEMLHDSREEEVDVEALADEQEVELHRLLQRVRPEAEQAVAEGRWERWLTLMTDVAQATDRFLAVVLVHDEADRLRGNRLALLQSAHRLFCRTVRLWRLGETEPASRSGGATPMA